MSMVLDLLWGNSVQGSHGFVIQPLLYERVLIPIHLNRNTPISD